MNSLHFLFVPFRIANNNVDIFTSHFSCYHDKIGETSDLNKERSISAQVLTKDADKHGWEGGVAAWAGSGWSPDCSQEVH